MRYRLLIINILLFCFSACTRISHAPCDSKPDETVIEYPIDGISTEGATALVKYYMDTAQIADVSIYGELGRIHLTYLLKKDSIYITEVIYKYDGLLNADVQIADSIISNLAFDRESLNDSSKNEYLDIIKDIPLVIP